MAKDKSVDKEERRKEKKEKKEKRSDTDGIHKSKKEKKSKTDGTDATALLNKIAEAGPGSVAANEDGDVKIVAADAKPLIGALVPFANPLADEKVGKKVLKSVKKGSFYFFYPIASATVWIVEQCLY
jgi:H/ACA ribonucleoprotein complex subunit 2